MVLYDKPKHTFCLALCKFSLGRDLAILARCNHTILSYGTYSFWAGYLSGGLRVIPKMILHRKRNPLNFTLKRFTMPDEDITANQIQSKMVTRK